MKEITIIVSDPDFQLMMRKFQRDEIMGWTSRPTVSVITLLAIEGDQNYNINDPAHVGGR